MENSTEVKVESVKAINLKTTVVTFSEPVDPATINATNVKVYVNNSNTAATVGTSVGNVEYTLSNDNKTLTITHATTLTQQDTVKIALNDVKAKDGKALAAYEKTVTAMDVAAPTVEEIKVTAPRTVRVQFSEPLASVPTFSLNNGNTAIVSVNQVNLAKGYVDLTIGVTPENGSTHTLNVKDGTDFAGFKVANVDKSFTYESDEVAPTATVEILAANKVKIKFDKPVTNVNDGNVSFYHTAKSTEYKLLNPSISTDKTEVTFELKSGQVLPEGQVNILLAYTNENGTKVQDTFGNKLAETTWTATYTADKTAPTITNVAAHSTTELDVTFDEEVNNANVAANYTLKDSTGAVVNVSSAVKQGTTNTYRLTTATLNGGSYTLAVKNVTDLSGNKLSDSPMNVSIADKVAPTVTATGDVVTNKKVRVNFSEAMDKASIEDKSNYGVGNAVLPEKVKVTAAPDNKSVILDFTDVTPAVDFTATPGSTTTINVGRVKDAAGNPTTALSTAVTVTHTSTLVTVAPKKQEAVSTKQVKLYFDEVITNAKASDFVVTQGSAKTIGGLSNDIVDGKSVITLTLADTAGNELAANTGASGGTAATVSTAAASTVTAVNSAGSKVAISSATIADKIAPSIAKTGTVDNIVIKDTFLANGTMGQDGIVDEIVLTFSENLKASTVSLEDFQVDGYTVIDLGVNNNVVTLQIKQGTVANMTDTFTVKLVGDISDLAGNVFAADASKEYKSIKLVTPAAPTGVAGGVGQITGTTTAMEYRAVGGTTWTTASATNTTVAAGNYEVRTAATSSALASATTTVTVTATPPVAPNTTFSFDGANASKLMGATNVHEFSLDGGTNWTDVTTNDQTLTAPQLAAIGNTNGIKVRVKAAGAVPAGNVQTIAITAAPAAPTGLTGTTDDSKTITDAANDTKYEYSTDGTTWTEVTSNNAGVITLPATGTYKLRLPATGTTLPSTATADITIS